MEMRNGQLLITGGLQRQDASHLGEGRRFHTARLVRCDFWKKQCEVVLEYRGNRDHYPDELPNILFTAATLMDDKLYLCTETEVFIYSYPDMSLLASTSLPCFQNVHHVAPVNGYVGVVSTGLDMLVLLDHETMEPVDYLNAMGRDPWHRFSADTDYRKVHSTKPHESHPNFVFSLDGGIWLTRFNQKDAVDLRDQTRRIDIGLERIHDGHVVGDRVYFTSVDGKIIAADTETLRVEKIIDLNELEDTDAPLGWCRGLAIDGEIAYVGFSRLRKTRITENVRWALSKALGVAKTKDTRIVAYDLSKERKIEEFNMSTDMTNVIYSVLSASGQ